MKKILSLLLLAGIIMGMTGCAEDVSGRYALIVNNTTDEALDCTDEVWEGIKTYAEDKEVGCCRYVPQGTERKDYADAIEEAVNNGAKVVVAVGEEMEVPVYEAQKDFQKVKFILLNGEPHKRYSKKTAIEKNAISLHFNETQQGFAAGYITVMRGFRNIGCMGGAETEVNLKVAAGFVQGVEAAGKELGLTKDSIQLSYTFTGVDKLSPAYMSKALDWYKGGCEAIFVLDEGVRLSVIEAAKIQSGWVLGTKKADMEGTDKMVTAAIIDYAGAVVNQLELIETESFTGGQVLNCGIREKGISLVMEDAEFSDNTMAEYNSMCQKLSEGILKVEETLVVPATTITTVVKE